MAFAVSHYTWTVCVCVCGGDLSTQAHSVSGQEAVSGDTGARMVRKKSRGGHGWLVELAGDPQNHGLGDSTTAAALGLDRLISKAASSSAHPPCLKSAAIHYDPNVPSLQSSWWSLISSSVN